MYDIFYVSKKQIPECEWKSFKLKYPTAQKIENVKSFEDLRSRSFTKMFWAVWDDLKLLDDFNLNTYLATKWDDMYVHIFKNGEYNDGICLFPKNICITQKEFDHRFFIEKKEIDNVISIPKKYDRFFIETYEDYQIALESARTDMFWIVPEELRILDETIFDLYFSYHNSYDRNINHVFQHKFRGELTYNGVMLMSKRKPVAAKEINFRFLVEKKQHEILVSELRPYDIVFISYNEPNADENYRNLLNRFPRAKRVDKVKGIHQAHKAAATISETEMFWAVDGDAVIDKDFNFDYEVSRYELDIVHVWMSKNPINDLEYGYGGVKLLPRNLTLAMDLTSADMTTSISKKFKIVPKISNLTSFNTDPFNTWKSAFRECVKLSSRIIERQQNAESELRLKIWKTKGLENTHGVYAIDGAVAGEEYGTTNKENKQALSLINDFDWLRKFYEQRAKNIHTKG
jgi:hypothetical protein